MIGMKRIAAVALALTLLVSTFSFGSLADRREIDVPDGKVRVTCDKPQAKDGDTVTLTAHASGFGDHKLSYQWQVNRGSGWMDIKKGDKREYSFTYTDKKVDYRWRVIVEPMEEPMEEPEESAESAPYPNEQPSDSVDGTVPDDQIDAESGGTADSASGESAGEQAESEEPQQTDAPGAEPTAEPTSEPKETAPDSDAPKPEAEPESEPKSKSESKSKPEPEQENIDDAEVPLSAGLDADGDGEIDIVADIENPSNGDTVTLSTALGNDQTNSILLSQWMVNRNDGKGFTPIPGANEMTYSYVYNDVSANYRFRVELSIPHTAE